MSDNDKKPKKPRTVSNDTSYEVRGSKHFANKQTNNTPKPKGKK